MMRITSLDTKEFSVVFFYYYYLNYFIRVVAKTNEVFILAGYEGSWKCLFKTIQTKNNNKTEAKMNGEKWLSEQKA